VVAAIAIPNLVKSKMAANEATAVGSLRTVVTAQIAYFTENPLRGLRRTWRRWARILTEHEGDATTREPD